MCFNKSTNKKNVLLKILKGAKDKEIIGIVFFKYNTFYGILVLYIFASMFFSLVLCDGPYYRKEIKRLSTKRSGGIKKKPIL